MKVNILGVDFDKVTMKEAVDKVIGFLKTDEFHNIYTPNPEIVMAARKDEELKKILNEASLVVPDGIGVVYGSYFAKTRLKERVPGYDLMQNVFKVIDNDKQLGQNIRVYFFGTKQEIVEESKKNMEQKYPNLNIVGFRNGYFKSEEELTIVDEINSLNVDILLVALGVPKQEKFIAKYKDKLKAKVCVGVGGSFDVMAGKLQRAPKLFQKLGLEWFYRLLQEPSRAGRMIQLPIFMLVAIREYIKGIFKK